MGVIGYGAGGQQAVLAACNIDFDATVDCYGEYVISLQAGKHVPFQVTNIINHLRGCARRCWGYSAKEDNYPSPEQVAELDEILAEENKAHEFQVTTTLAMHSSTSTARRTALLPPMVDGNA